MFLLNRAADTDAETRKGGQEAVLVCGLFALLFVLTYWRYWSIGFTDHDSMYVAIRWWHDDFPIYASELTQRQGRINHYYASYLYALPFLLRNVWWYNAIRYSCFLQSLECSTGLYVVGRTTGH